MDVHERHECAMLVPGTNAFLPGHGPFLRYMLRLKETNYDITEVKLMRCKRAIYFGGDANLECTSTVQLPLCIGGKYGYVQMYLLPGENPDATWKANHGIPWLGAGLPQSHDQAGRHALATRCSSKS